MDMMDTIFLGIIAAGVVLLAIFATTEWMADEEFDVNVMGLLSPEDQERVRLVGTRCDICGDRGHHPDDHTEPWDEGEETGPTILVIRDDYGNVVPFLGYDDDEVPITEEDEDELIDFEAKLAALRGEPMKDDHDGLGLWEARPKQDD